MSEEKSKLLCQCPKQSSETKKIYVTLCGHRVICRTLITNENFNTRSFWCVKSKIEAHNRRYVVREEKKKLPICYIVDTYGCPKKFTLRTSSSARQLYFTISYLSCSLNHNDYKNSVFFFSSLSQMRSLNRKCGRMLFSNSVFFNFDSF